MKDLTGTEAAGKLKDKIFYSFQEEAPWLIRADVKIDIEIDYANNRASVVTLEENRYRKDFTCKIGVRGVKKDSWRYY